MIDPSRRLSREEVLSLFSALIFTSLFAAWMLYLRQADLAEHGVAVLMEYEEILPASRLSRDSPTVQSAHLRQRPRRTSSPAAVAAAKSDSLETRFTTRDHLDDKVPAADSVSSGTQSLPVSTATIPGPMFRTPPRSTILDSIFALDAITRQGLLHQHFSHTSAIYDTATVVHLTRLTNNYFRFEDMPVSLEQTMRLNMHRYGYPYDPNRPQPPSAQIPVEGIVTRLLRWIF